MSETAVELRTAAPLGAEAASAQVIDIRTRRAWAGAPAPVHKAVDRSVWLFLRDAAIVAVTCSLGAWFFLKMTGG